MTCAQQLGSKIQHAPGTSLEEHDVASPSDVVAYLVSFSKEVKRVSQLKLVHNFLSAIVTSTLL